MSAAVRQRNVFTKSATSARLALSLTTEVGYCSVSSMSWICLSKPPQGAWPHFFLPPWERRASASLNFMIFLSHACLKPATCTVTATSAGETPAAVISSKCFWSTFLSSSLMEHSEAVLTREAHTCVRRAKLIKFLLVSVRFLHLVHVGSSSVHPSRCESPILGNQVGVKHCSLQLPDVEAVLQAQLCHKLHHLAHVNSRVGGLADLSPS